MYKLTVLPQREIVSFQSEITVLELLRQYGFILESPCGGKGICGKCKIIVISGEVSSPEEGELNKLTPEEVGLGVRLACFAKAQGDITISLDRNFSQEMGNILTYGFMPDFELNPNITKLQLTTKDLLNNDNSSCLDAIKKYLKSSSKGELINYININNLRSFPQLLKNDTITAVYAGEELIGIEEGNTCEHVYGVALDIGTTTVVASLINLQTGIELSTVAALNPQIDYGLDVLTRIEFTMQKEENLEILRHALVKCINQLITDLCYSNKLSIKYIYEIIVAANPTMTHLLLGVDPGSIGTAPCRPIFTEALSLTMQELGINGSTFGCCYLLPGVSGYIGSDVVAGALVTRLAQTEQNILFIDLGTNGEIIVSRQGQLIACSCAAGPALEGMSIKKGMRATTGAIERVAIEEEGIKLEVIGGGTPIGICGSGIIEAVGQLVTKGIVEPNGRLKNIEDLATDNGERIFMLAKNAAIGLTQGDIRQVQLAKAAINSGYISLLEIAGLTIEDIDQVIIAGQFGAHLTPLSLVEVGIIPQELQGKVKYIGNSAKTGAMLCLLSKPLRDEFQQLTQQISYFELATSPKYMQTFTDCLFFKK